MLDYGMEPAEMKEFVEVLDQIEKEFRRIIDKIEKRVIKLYGVEYADYKLYSRWSLLYDQFYTIYDLFGQTPTEPENMKPVDWLEWGDELDRARKELREQMNFGWGKIVMKNLFPNEYKI